VHAANWTHRDNCRRKYIGLLYLVVSTHWYAIAQAYVTLGLIPDAIQCSMVGHLEFIHNNNKHLCEYENEMAYNIYIRYNNNTNTGIHNFYSRL